MPLRTTTPPVCRFPRLALVLTLTTVGYAVAGAVAIGSDRDQAVAAHPVIRYHDIEANKARSMAALGRHLSQGTTSYYDDLQANKARSQSALGD